MILAGLIGTLSASGGGVAKSISLGSIAYNTISEGVEQTVNLDYVSWDNSTVYWTIKNNLGAELTSQVTPVSGDFNPGSGSGTYSINFTFDVDTTTDGSLTYYLYVGSIPGSGDYITSSGYTVRDSSQAQALFLDLDPANWDVDWYDSSGQSNDASMNNLTDSGDNGGVFDFNGTSSYANVPTLTNSIYGSVTVSAWINPTAVNRTQTIISKEICYKMIITSDGRIAWMVGDASGNSWTTTIYAAAGLVTAGAWSHVLATVDADATKIYVNGVLASTGGGATLITNSYRFAIGAYDVGQAGFGDFFGGRFGEVKMWNYALTETVVIGQYNTTAARYGRSVIPLSLDFPLTGDPYLLVSNTQSDWNLGSTYTIEFWSKETNASTSNIRTVMSQGYAGGQIDLGYAYGNLLFNNTQPSFAEPTPAIWTHVAFVRESGSSNITLYYNGINRTSFSAESNLTDGSSDLNIGRRAGVNGQGFKGKLAMIRISTTAKYTAGFNPSVAYGVEADTKLMLGYDPLVDTSTLELNGLSASANGGTRIYFAKSTYPDLNNQVRVGYTVVSGNDPTTSVVTGAVYTSDPDNWGVPVSPGWLTLPGAINFSGPGRHPISVQGAVGISTDFPVPSVRLLEGTALGFDGSSNRYVQVTGTRTDWNLGDNWTIEWWEKMPDAGTGNFRGVIAQMVNSDPAGLDIWHNNGSINVNNAQITFAQPTPGTWHHIAVQKDGATVKAYIDGVSKTLTRNDAGASTFTNTSNDLIIGDRTFNGTDPIGQKFNGQLANIRISSVARYTTTFIPPTTVAVDAATRLALSGQVGGSGMLVDAASNHTITNVGATVDTIV